MEPRDGNGDNGKVMDQKFRVEGVENLRVVDAIVFSGPIAATP